MTLPQLFRRMLLLGMLPLVVLCSALALAYLNNLRATEDIAMRRVAQNFLAALDADIAARLAGLHVLAASHPLYAGDYDAFDAQARTFAKQYGGQVLLADDQLQMQVNTVVPRGAPLTKLPRPTGRSAAGDALASGRPAVGDRVWGPVAKDWLVAVAVPVPRESTPPFVLINTLSTRLLTDRIDKLLLPTGARLSIHDSTGTPLARSDWNGGPAETPTDAAADFEAQLAIRLQSSVTPWSVVLESRSDTYRTALHWIGAGLAAAIVAVTALAAAMMRRVQLQVAREIDWVIHPSDSPGRRRPAIAELAQAQAAIDSARTQTARSEALFRTLVVAASQSVWHYRKTADPSDAIAQSHFRWWCAFTGQDPAECNTDRGKGWLRMVHPDDRDRALDGVRRIIHAQGNREATFRVRRKDGAWRWLEILGTPLRGPDGEIESYAGTFHDITERRQAAAALEDANRRLLALSTRLIETQENERRHLSRELHDQVGQALTALKITLQSASQRPDATPVRADLDFALHAADEALADVRAMSLALRPPQLDDLGLAAALRWQLEKQANLGGCDFEFQDLGTPRRLPDPVAVSAYRIAQEALTNAVRHAQASTLRLRIGVDQDVLQLRIEDNGRGFARDEEATHKHSLGLTNMTERARLVGGDVRIDSHPGGGTVVAASLPCPPPDPDPLPAPAPAAAGSFDFPAAPSAS